MILLTDRPRALESPFVMYNLDGVVEEKRDALFNKTKELYSNDVLIIRNPTLEELDHLKLFRDTKIVLFLDHCDTETLQKIREIDHYELLVYNKLDFQFLKETHNENVHLIWPIVNWESYNTKEDNELTIIDCFSDLKDISKNTVENINNHFLKDFENTVRYRGLKKINKYSEFVKAQLMLKGAFLVSTIPLHLNSEILKSDYIMGIGDNNWSFPAELMYYAMNTNDGYIFYTGTKGHTWLADNTIQDIGQIKLIIDSTDKDKLSRFRVDNVRSKIERDFQNSENVQELVEKWK